MRASVTLSHVADLQCQTRRPDGDFMAVDSAAATNSDRGYNPLELLALSHGTCTAMMMAKAGNSIGLNLAQMQVEVVHEYSLGPPMLLQSAILRFHLPCSTSPEQREQLQKGAALCPVHSALRNGIPVTFELIPGT